MSRQQKRKANRPEDEHPAEISMTDLGWTEDVDERPQRSNGADDTHAAGTPGGGTASGGLAGTNVGDGDPDNVDLEDALGSGIRDTAGEDADAPAYGGEAGGAVGGSPARKRASGGQAGPRTVNALRPTSGRKRKS
jgi:hypothetical protein